MNVREEITIPRRSRTLIKKVTCGKGLTEQSHKDECNINLIVRKYQRTGFIEHANRNEGRYDDVSPQDFQSAQILVANTNSMFEQLPSSVRKEFNHNPAEFLRYVQDPANEADLLKRGILIGNDGVNAKGEIVNSPVAKVEPPEPVTEPQGDA